MNTPGSNKFALVIPTLNEVGNIRTLIDRVQTALSHTDIDYELIVVDDNSQDGTAELVRRYAEHDSRIKLLVRVGERGLAGAVIHGWANTDANWLGVMDADLQHPPELLPELLKGLQRGDDIVIASRYAGNGTVGNWNAVRHFISRASTVATLPLQRPGLRIKDPMSGFFMVRREAIEGIDLQPQGFKILLEILVRGRIRRAEEIPFTFATRHAGESKASLKVAIEYFALLGKLSRYALFRAGQQ
jgi:dolichol-phosphate mannosyltransferase